jgi:hypothetical protein
MSIRILAFDPHAGQMTLGKDVKRDGLGGLLFAADMDGFRSIPMSFPRAVPSGGRMGPVGAGCDPRSIHRHCQSWEY